MTTQIMTAQEALDAELAKADEAGGMGEAIVSALLGVGTYVPTLTAEEDETLQKGVFEVMDLDAQLDLASDPNDATRWIVRGHIKAEGYTFLYGREGSGKSISAIDLAIAATHDRLWLNRLQVMQCNVLYIDDDSNTPKTWRSRVKQMGGKYGKKLYSILLQNVALDNEDRRKEILLYCKKLNITLVVMDAFQRFHSLQDRDAVQMRHLNMAIKEFFQAGIAVVMIHHATKAGSFQGSTEIMSIADNSYIIEKIKKKGGGVDFSISPVKIRDVVDDTEPEALAVMPRTVNGVLILDTITLAEYHRKYGEEGYVDETKIVKPAPIYKLIVDTMRRCEGPVSQSKLTEMIGFHPRRGTEVKAALARLLDLDVVMQVEGVRAGVVAYVLGYEADAAYDTLDEIDDDNDGDEDDLDDMMG